MRKYDRYKDSGIEWIGEIPNLWKVKKIKHRCYVKARVGWKGLKSDEFLQEGYAYLVTGSDFKNDKVNWKECYHIDKERYDEDSYIQLQDEDLLITKDGTIGKLAIVKNLDKPACLNSGIFVVRSIKDDFSTEFLFWILKSKMFTQFNEYTSYGSTIQHLYQNVFIEFGFTFPTIKEQTAIATYLDKKIAEINTLIADKKRLLEFYKEEKTAVINQAVTKGINPKAKMKDSGIEWLGEIPEHWEVKRIRHVAQIFGRIGYRGYKTTDLVVKGEGAITISPSNMKNYFMDFSDCSYLSWEKYEESPEIMINEGDILFVKTGSTYGKSSLVESLPEKATINPQIIVIKKIQCNNNLLWYIIKSEYTQFQVEGTVVGGTIPTISQAKINNYEFAITPDEKEQQEIVDFIKTECIRIDAKIAKTQKLIELLTEYRTALISEVVTGKIKVMD